jgi:hypothetical protein
VQNEKMKKYKIKVVFLCKIKKRMNTALIEIKNDYAESILQGLVNLKAIRIVKREKVALLKKEKLSTRFAGCLKLTDVEYESMQNQLKEMRSEWERNIY